MGGSPRCWTLFSRQNSGALSSQHPTLRAARSTQHLTLCAAACQTARLLRAENLGKRYGNRWIFRGLNFELTIGRRLLVIGRNGSSKSTLLQFLAGLLL